MSQSIGAPAPRRRKAAATPDPTPHFNAQIIQFSSRPRLMVGDVVELCRDCLPSNRGKLAVIVKIDEEGDCYIRSLMWNFDLRDKNTGVIEHRTAAHVWMSPANLYRRGSSLVGKNGRLQ